ERWRSEGPTRRRPPPSSETCVPSERPVGPALVLGIATLAVAACSSGKSFIVLELQPEGAGVVIAGVEQIVVRVSQPPSLLTTLTYPAGGITIDQAHKNDL